MNTTFCFIQRLKAALHAVCGKICEQLQTQSNVTVSKQAVAAIGDITFQQVATFCQDLDAFARWELFFILFGRRILLSIRHGKRSTINADDVRLLARRNPGLLDKLDEYQRSLKTTKAANKSTTSTIAKHNSSSRYDDHNVDITVVDSSSDMDDISW
jgi:centromere protein S